MTKVKHIPLDVFTRNTYRDIIIESLSFCIKNKALRVYRIDHFNGKMLDLKQLELRLIC